MVNAFSFCLYGPENPKYYTGLLENIFLAGKYFPDWKVYVYYGPDVSDSIIAHLRACTSVELRETHVTGPINMIHRFYAIDEPQVDLMMVRDADSRIHWKDRWAIRQFAEQPQYVAHTIRDHIEHTADMMGGLWGLRKSSGLNMHAEYAAYKEDTERGHRHAHDQNFLSDVIYPKVISRILVHYSNGRIKLGEKAAFEFPFEWSNANYCGRIEGDFYDSPQPREKRQSILPEVRVRVRDPVVEAPPAPVQREIRIAAPANPNLPILNFLHRK